MKDLGDKSGPPECVTNKIDGDDEYLILVDMKCLAGAPPCDRTAVLLISVIFTARVLTTNIWVTLIV